MMKGIDLEQELHRLRDRDEAREGDQVLAAFKDILARDDAQDDAIYSQLFGKEPGQPSLHWKQLDPQRIFTLGQIKKLCTDYRLRFLDARYFKGEIPREAIAKIKSIQRQAGVELSGYKMIAPAPMFHLQKKDSDPLLMVPLGKGRYYLIHKWGRDLHPLRKLMVFPFRNFKSLLGSIAGLVALIAMSIPSSVMTGPYDSHSLAIRVIFFFYLFLAFCGLTALYGFSRVKNFNSVLWNSRYQH